MHYFREGLDLFNYCLGPSFQVLVTDHALKVLVFRASFSMPYLSVQTSEYIFCDLVMYISVWQT